MDKPNIKRNKRVFYELQNSNSSSNLKKPKLTHDEIAIKNENCSTKQCEEFLTKTIEIFLVLHPKAESILQNLTDEHFVKCFNFDKVMARCLLIELHQRTFYRVELDDTPAGIPFDLSVLAALSYMVNGHLEYVGQLDYFMNFSSHTLKKCIMHVCKTIVYFLTPSYVNFPCSSKEQEANKTGFLQQFGVPGVVGVIDCFHISLTDIQPNEVSMYLNKRFEQSLSVQLICDKNFRFLDVNPRFSGYTHKLHIWKRSHIQHILKHSQEKETKTWLVADRGYHLSPVIINPYRNPIHKRQKDVNEVLDEVHEVIVKSFSILKARFRCLNTSLPFNHVNSANIITSCVTLHNYLIAKHQAIIDNQLSLDLPIKKKLPNARFEDPYSQIAEDNRKFINDFLYNNSLKRSS